MHPLHANGVSIEAEGVAGKPLAPVNVSCGMPINQFSWQEADRTGREEIADAIGLAEDRISAALGFKPIPDWEAAEDTQYPRPANPQLFNVSALDIRAYWQSIATRWGYVVSTGQEAKTLISANAAVAYTDADGDGYFELATISVATTVTDVQEIAAYYPGHNGEDAWEIRPINVSIAAGTATITCRKEQLVDEERFMGLIIRPTNGMNDVEFLASVAVYRHYNDPSIQAQFLWESVGGANCDCGLSTCIICGLTSQNGCLVIRNQKLGRVAAQPSTWNATTSTFDSAYFTVCGRAPDRIKLWYRAGWKNDRLAQPYKQMDQMWERAITYYALALMHRPLCACQSVRAQMLHWADDLAQNKGTPGATTSFQIARKLLDNPLGTSRGAMYAWDLVRRYRVDTF